MISTGNQLGRYRIRSAIGKGGMGEVFLAEDSELERLVALKVLPVEVANDSERLRRFAQEAKSASALNHPNIITIYEIGKTIDTHFIATEYIEGETLHERLKSEPMNLKSVLDVAIQVASALDAAHRAGIVHRDIKPENVMIRPDGVVKILDFGIAKLTEKKAELIDAEAATAIKAGTQDGMIIGTASYMSPEQARGKDIDARSDIFSFGVVLYEMLAGKQGFAGESAIDTISAIIHKDPAPLNQITSDVPRQLQHIVEKSLRKDREERYQTTKDLVIDLKDVRQDLQFQNKLERTSQPNREESKTQILSATTSDAAHTTSSAEYVVSEIKRHKTSAAIVVTLLAFVVAGIGYGIYKYSANKQNKPVPSSSQMKLTRLTTTGKATVAAISPDGKYVVYAMNDNGQQSLWMRQTATESNVQIVPPAANVEYARLIFSPDGNYLFYTTAAERNADTATLYQIPVLGGSPKKLLSNISSFMALSPDALQIVFKRAFPAESIDTLMIANVDGTNERRLAIRKLPGRAFELGGTRSAPAWSPDGKTIACKITNVEGGVIHDGLAAIDVASGQETLITTSQKFYSMGQLAWLNDKSGLIMLAADELGGAAQLWHLSYPEGEARRITNDLNNYRTISLTADSKSLVTVQFQQTSSIWVAPPNDVARAKQITSGVGRDDDLGRWTPDNKIVFDSDASGSRNVWIMDADGGNRKQLTTEGGLDASVSPDGSYIAFASNRLGARHIFRMDINGGNVKQLTNGSGEFVPVFSPDGKWVLYNSRESGKITLWRVSAQGGEPKQLTDKYSHNISVSPDGKWLTANYREDTPNAPDKIAIFPFEGGQPVKIFDNIPTRGQRIYWTPDSRALIYMDTRGGVSNLWTQPVDGGAAKQITDFKQERIFSYDYSRDGKQLALSRGTINNDVVMISNFK